ncbi:hypothetical protein FACS1894181_01200 [Bacteroidia bacterium]|nr:hypothetical protein FACS1894181_01200 [Bacteroidia bacterium]
MKLMKKNCVSLLVAAAFVISLASCGGKKANDATQEKAASEAGISKSVLTEELKQETIQLLRDMPASDIPQRIATGEIELGVGNLSYMLPISKASELVTASQKARALGIYLADYNVLKILGQPLAEIENAMAKLTSDLDITFVLNILKETTSVPKEELKQGLQTQEGAIINMLAANNKMDVAIAILGGITVENAYLYANPSLSVKGDITYIETLSDNMLKRFGILEEVVSDLSTYYPDLKTLVETMNPLKDKLASLETARKSNAEIRSIRDVLLK